MQNDFENIIALWKKYNNYTMLLSKAMNGTKNIVGEFSEQLVGKYYEAKQMPASNQCFDLLGKNGERIQVKSRKIAKTKCTALNVFRSWDFDILVVVLFADDGNILHAITIDSQTAQELSKYSAHQRGDILTTSGRLLNNPKAKDITNDLRRIIKQA